MPITISLFGFLAAVFLFSFFRARENELARLESKNTLIHFNLNLRLGDQHRKIFNYYIFAEGEVNVDRGERSLSAVFGVQVSVSKISAFLFFSIN